MAETNNARVGFDLTDPTLPDGTLVTRSEVAKYLRIIPTSWDRAVREGRAPKACTPSGFLPRWRLGDIRAWMRDGMPKEEAV
jgi:hypothetical protein